MGTVIRDEYEQHLRRIDVHHDFIELFYGLLKRAWSACPC